MPASIRHLRMFLALGRSHSVTRAAEVSHVSQPAVTQAMAKLSQDSGHPLFRRSPQGLFLTDAVAMRPIGITTRAGWEPTRAQREFLDLLRRTVP